jgi:acyl-coenzyme A synthetase/AMP-(fatty) acid ligase
MEWSVAEAVRNRIRLSGMDASDQCLVALPLHSSAGIRRMLSGLLTGGSIICAGALTTDVTIELLESLAPTQYFAPPASHIALLEAFERRTPRPRHCLKALWSGTTELPDAICARLERTFGVPIIVGYGTTESGCIAHAPLPPARVPAGSVGRATDVELGIADDAGEFLGPRRPARSSSEARRYSTATRMTTTPTGPHSATAGSGRAISATSIPTASSICWGGKPISSIVGA